MAQKIRILLIENFAEDFVKARLGWAIYLKNAGYEVYALVPSNKGKGFEFPEDISIFWYDYSKHERGWKGWWSYVQRFRKVIREIDPDIIHSYRFHPNLISTLSNFFNKRKLVLHITGLGILFSSKSIHYAFHRWLARCIYLILLIRANKIIVQNEDNYHRLNFLGMGRKNIAVIAGSGVDVSVFKKDMEVREKVRKEWGIKQDERVYIMVSRLIWEKGILELVEAFSRIDKPLWIVGWPDEDNPRSVDDAFIRKWNGRRGIRFLGKRNDVFELLNGSDVYIYPSYYGEGVPRGILEALAVGMPILTTDMPGCRDTVREGINGRLIPPKSVEAILDGVFRMEGEDLLAMGLESRKIAEKFFSNEVIFKQIEGEYKKLL